MEFNITKEDLQKIINKEKEVFDFEQVANDLHTNLYRGIDVSTSSDDDFGYRTKYFKTNKEKEFYNKLKIPMVDERKNILQPLVSGTSKIQVFRSGKQIPLTMNDITIGDVIFFKKKDIIPADGIVIDSSNLKVDDLVVTGKMCQEVSKEKGQNIILCGSKVCHGSGKMIVLAIGSETKFGKKVKNEVEVSESEYQIDRANREINNLKKQVKCIIL